jgi:broad specificity phosphatase PhoE
MSVPALFYVRHGLTDWNKAGRLQGRHDIPLNPKGRAQAAHCAGILRDLFAREGRAPQDYDYVSSPLARAYQSMDVIRAALDLAAGGYTREPRLSEIAFGEWEGLTYQDVLKRENNLVQKREGNKWRFRPPGGETYEEVAERVGAWHASLTRDTVVTAHGGTARALVAHLGIAAPEEATHYSIDQGVVYLFADGRMTRYE